MCNLVEVFDIGRLRRSPARRHGLLHERTARELGAVQIVSQVGEGKGNDDDTSAWSRFGKQTVRRLAYPPGSKKDSGGRDFGTTYSRKTLLQPDRFSMREG
jgi:hypothetical protein